jgi:hypothetical protein
MRARSALLEALSGEEGCRRLSAAFYARVGKDPVLRPFFPGKSLGVLPERPASDCQDCMFYRFRRIPFDGVPANWTVVASRRRLARYET